MTSGRTLEAVLTDAQRLGLLGARPIDQVMRHAQSFVQALTVVRGRVIDLGSGGGVPGLVVAAERPDLELTLVDRRQKRTDFLERAVARLGWGDRCVVWCRDVREVVREQPQPWNAAISRGFGPPEVTVALARRLVEPSGRIVVSEPPSSQGDRWPADRLASLLVKRLEPCPPGVVVLSPDS